MYILDRLILYIPDVHLYVIGAGVILCYSATAEIVARYFTKRKHIAFPLSVLGYYVGASIWPSLSQALFYHIGYAKSMALMSIAHAVHILVGFLLVDPDCQENYGNYGELCYFMAPRSFETP